MPIIDYFKNSPYFDRRRTSRNITVRKVQDVKDDTGEYTQVPIEEYTEINVFISNVDKRVIKPEILEKYNELKYVYLSRKLTLQDTQFSSILIIDGQIFKVVDDRDFNLDSGFYKYLVGGTGKNAV